MILMKIINSILFFGRLNFRNPLYILSMIIGFLYLSVIIYTYSSSELTNPGNMLQLSSFLIQGYMLIFMFLGFQSINLEYINCSKDLFLTIPKSFNIKIAGNFMFINITNFLLSLISLILILLTYKITGFSFSTFYLTSIYFVIIYWFIPGLISSLIGGVFALLLSKKISVAAIVSTWLLISPMNIYFSNSFFVLLGFDYLPGFLHLGVPDPEMSYHAFSGFVFTKEDFINKISWILLLTLIFLLVFFQKNARYKNIKIFVGLVVIFGLFIGFTQFFSMETKINPTKFNQRNINELNYYGETQFNQITQEQSFKIKKYDVNLEISDELDAIVHLFFEGKEEGNKLFSLYHGFNVTKIEDEYGELIDYNQQLDLLEVKLEQPTEEIKISYAGVSSPYMDVNNDFAYLPFYFAWIPLKQTNPTMRYTYHSNHRLPNQPNEYIEYNLKYAGPKGIYTNLKEIRKGVYSGVSSTGISLIYGELSQKEVNNYTITFPLTWENSIKFVKSYLDQLEKTFDLINNLFLVEQQSLPKDILFIPARGANDTLSSETMWYKSGEELLILISPYEHHDNQTFKEKEYLIAYEMLSALLWKKQGVVYQDYDISIIFNSLTGRYVNEKLGVVEPPYSENDFWIEEVLHNITNKNDKRIIQNIISFVSSDSSKEIESFLVGWSDLLKEKEVDWKSVDNLLESYKKGGVYND